MFELFNVALVQCPFTVPVVGSKLIDFLSLDEKILSLPIYSCVNKLCTLLMNSFSWINSGEKKRISCYLFVLWRQIMRNTEWGLVMSSYGTVMMLKLSTNYFKQRSNLHLKRIRKLEENKKSQRRRNLVSARQGAWYNCCFLYVIRINYFSNRSLYIYAINASLFFKHLLVGFNDFFFITEYQSLTTLFWHKSQITTLIIIIFQMFWLFCCHAF